MLRHLFLMAGFSCFLLGTAGDARATEPSKTFNVTGQKWRPINTNPQAAHFQRKSYRTSKGSEVTLDRVLCPKTGKLEFFSKVVLNFNNTESLHPSSGASVHLHIGRLKFRQDRTWGSHMGRNLESSQHYLRTGAEWASISEAAFNHLVANNK